MWTVRIACRDCKMPVMGTVTLKSRFRKKEENKNVLKACGLSKPTYPQPCAAQATQTPARQHVNQRIYIYILISENKQSLVRQPNGF